MRYVALLAVLVVLVPVATGATAAAAVQPADQLPTADRMSGSVDAVPQAIAPPTGSASPQVASSVGTPRTNFTVSLREDGSARWTVETRVSLEDEAARDAFREYARSYETGDAEGGPTVEPFRNAAVAASEATGREMSIDRVNRTATLANGSGALRLRFTWTGFLEPGNDGVLALGDAFRTPNNGTWFGSLSADQRLVIEPPADYEVSDVSQGFSYSISDRRIVAQGPQQFEAGDIAVRYEPGDSPPPNSSYLLELLAGAGVVLLFAVAVLAYRRGNVANAGTGDADSSVESISGKSSRSTAETDTAPADNGGYNGDGGSAVAASGRPEDGEGSVDDAAGTVAGNDGTTVDGTDEPGVDADDSASKPQEDLELLSDEERVERLLDEHGGRMRQGTIVEKTGWSDAKVSQLLSAMADDGRVEKLRLGRENLISLADGDEATGDEADGNGANTDTGSDGQS
ncbi:helix-turn-helix transcriptional regulator [Halobaculum rarum]|uniref:helix-turn-helix transcriptional regulator n=1 Tax=Halobaculum rarum TaxID=3075122 RepID=UPI0032AF50D8